MRLGLDLDGVCYEFQRTAMYMLRAYRGYTREQLSDVKKWKHWDWMNGVVKKDDLKWLWTEGVRLGLFRYGHLYPGVVKAANELEDMASIVVITHRPPQACLDTMDWLSYNKIPVSEVHFLSKAEPKSSVRPECDVYVDDGLHVVADLARHTKAKVLLWTRPWNKGKPPNGVERVSDWDDVMDKMAKLRGYSNEGISRVRVLRAS